jgi:hypothetical protein
MSIIRKAVINPRNKKNEENKYPNLPDIQCIVTKIQIDKTFIIGITTNNNVKFFSTVS